jgi:hypothetical protein
MLVSVLVTIHIVEDVYVYGQVVLVVLGQDFHDVRCSKTLVIIAAMLLLGL